jgi:hypothetical protein
MNNTLTPTQLAKLAKLLPEIIEIEKDFGVNYVFTYHTSLPESRRGYDIKVSDYPYLTSLAEAKLTEEEWVEYGRNLHAYVNHAMGRQLYRFYFTLTPAQRIDAMPEPE